MGARRESTQAPVVRAGQRPALPPPEGVEVRRRVVYGRGGGRDLTLDLFLPENAAAHCPPSPPPELGGKGGAAPMPGMIFIHGGGWSGGTPAQFYRQAGSLAAQGIVSASISYRLSGEAKYPAAVEDAKCAVRWMRASARELNVDPERIGCAGGSAGGYLAAMLAATPDVPRFEGSGGHTHASSRVCLAVLFNPVLDLAGLAEEQMSLDLVASFLGAPPEGNAHLYEDASPITHAGPRTAPCLLFHGTDDDAVPYAQSVRFRNVLSESGVPAELVSYDGQGHAFFNRSPHYESTYTRMEAWLEERFG